MANGIDLVLADHRQVEELFAQLFQTRKGIYAGMIFGELAAHDDAENGALYPLAAAVLTDVALLERSLAAHSRVKQLIDHAKNQEGDPLIDAMRRLQAAVQTHVKDEETKLLPALQSAATPQQLEGLAARWEQIKQRVG